MEFTSHFSCFSGGQTVAKTDRFVTENHVGKFDETFGNMNQLDPGSPLNGHYFFGEVGGNEFHHCPYHNTIPWDERYLYIPT